MTTGPAPAPLELWGVPVELLDRGAGRPVVFLHPHIGLHGSEALIAELAACARVLAPSHPGFGRTGLPEGFSTVDDISYFYLELFERLDVRDAVLVGASFGGWIAMALATKTTERLSRLVLIDPLGVKLGPRDRSDFVDIFAHPQAKLDELAWHRPPGRRDFAALSDEELTIIARNRHATGLYGWNPYMHDPGLRGRLHRIRIPTLVLWGASDRMYPPGWGHRYAEAIPDAAYGEIPEAGHFPHIEQPQAVAREIARFAGLGQAQAAA